MTLRVAQIVEAKSPPLLLSGTRDQTQRSPDVEDIYRTSCIDALKY